MLFGDKKSKEKLLMGMLLLPRAHCGLVWKGRTAQQITAVCSRGVTLLNLPTGTCLGHLARFNLEGAFGFLQSLDTCQIQMQHVSNM